MKPKSPRILVAPLNWGLGHASRCIPIIKKLIEKGAEPIIAADEKPLALLKEYFPKLESIPFPGIKVQYSDHIPFSLDMMLKLPQFMKAYQDESSMIQELVSAHAIDAIISDNRYGLSVKGVPSVFISHQLAIKSPILQSVVRSKIQKYIEDFDVCWVPDFSGDINLSGDLSHTKSKLSRTKFIGPLSRFEAKQNIRSKKTENVLAILSGPEPKRTNFEKQLLAHIEDLNQTALVVRGLNLGGPSIRSNNSKIEIVNHLGSDELQAAIEASSAIVCRSGYSSIMDLVALGKTALLVPTPGQTEQEYLAKHLSANKWFVCQKESHLNLKEGFKQLNHCKSFPLEVQSELLEVAIDDLLNQISQ